MTGYLDPFCYESERVIRATPAHVWAVVSQLETWNRFYPGTVRATYLGRDADVPISGGTVIEKYMARSGYAVIRHEILQVREPGLIEWEGRIIDAPVLVGNPAADQIRAIRGRFAYIVEAVRQGVRWRRTCRFHTIDPAGGDSYLAFMREFFPGLTQSLEVYMDLVREHVERLAEGS